MSGIRKFGLLALIWAVCLTAQLAVSASAQAQAAPRPANKPPAAVTSGFLKSMTGSVFISRGNAREVPAKPGDLLSPPVIIRADAGSEAVLLFADGQSVTLGGDSVLRIDVYQFDTANVKTSRASLLLEYGQMRVVTGVIHTDNPSALRIGAGSASVSILSKDVSAFVVEVERDQVGRASAAVTIGAISIQTPAGRIERVDADQFARWQNGVAPSPAQPLAAAPAVFQAIVAASRATVEGAGAPLDVQSAAVQAALSVGQAGAQGTPSSTTVLSLNGQLNKVSGKVYIVRDSGVRAEAKIGDTFGPGTTISTTSGGEAGLLFTEGVYASLGENSTFRISRPQSAERADETSASSLGLLTGRLSFVTWAAPVGNALRISAGDASISVLNQGMAAFVVEVDSASPGTGIAVVSAGQVSLQTPNGPPIVITADHFTVWQPGVSPSGERPMAEAPLALQLAFIGGLTPRGAEVLAEVGKLPPTGAGPSEAQPPSATPTAPQPSSPPPPTQAAPAPPSLPPAVILPAVSSGGGGGCVGSPC